MVFKGPLGWIELIQLISTAAALSEVFLQYTEGTIKLRPDGTYSVTVTEGKYVEIDVTFTYDYGLDACLLNVYFEIRDGLNQSGSLLGLFCEFNKKGQVFRSSGRSIWIKLQRYKPAYQRNFHIKYTARPVNATGM